MEIKLLLVGLAYAMVRGIYQGIIMHMPNCRDHLLYPFYHRTMVLDAVLAAWVGIIINQQNLATWTTWPLFVGLFCLAWEVFELSYSYTRGFTFFSMEENIMGSGKNISKRTTQLLHIGRVVCGVIFLILSKVV